MSLLINDELIWVSIPKNASFSIESALKKSKLNITESKMYVEYRLTNDYNQEPHIHIKKNLLLEEFGNKETFCINRDPVDRFISAIKFIWRKIDLINNHTPIIPLEEIDNDFIYNLFNKDIIDNILYEKGNRDVWAYVYNNFVKENIKIDDIPIGVYQSIITIIPQEQFKNNEKCTYEFNVNNLQLFVDFIYSKYNVYLDIPIRNKTPDEYQTKIINNKEFSNWYYSNFYNNKKINKIL